MTSYVLMLIMFVFSVFTFAESSINNIESPNNLKATKNLGCIDMNKVKNTYTPADLFLASVECANNGNAEDSARLFLFARVYGSYDMSRVKDKTAHQGIRVLVQQAFTAMGNNANAVGKEINDNLISKPENFVSFCNAVKKAGKPNYHPEYLISHGMSALAGKGSGSGIVNNFNDEKAWNETLTRCG